MLKVLIQTMGKEYFGKLINVCIHISFVGEWEIIKKYKCRVIFVWKLTVT